MGARCLEISDKSFLISYLLGLNLQIALYRAPLLN